MSSKNTSVRNCSSSKIRYNDKKEPASKLLDRAIFSAFSDLYDHLSGWRRFIDADGRDEETFRTKEFCKKMLSEISWDIHCSCAKLEFLNVTLPEQWRDPIRRMHREFSIVETNHPDVWTLAPACNDCAWVEVALQQIARELNRLVDKGSKKSRASSVDANERAFELLKISRNFWNMNARFWGKSLGCSAALVVTLDAWEKRFQGRNVVKGGSVRTSMLDDATLESIATDGENLVKQFDRRGRVRPCQIM